MGNSDQSDRLNQLRDEGRRQAGYSVGKNTSGATVARARLHFETDFSI